MRLGSFETRQHNGLAIARCQLEWEDCARPAETIEFSIHESHGVTPAPAPEAFLLAALAPAIAAGEQRIYIDAHLSPMLLRGLPTAMALLRRWNPDDFARPFAPQIEHWGERSLEALPGARHGVFYSGGVDSTHLLLASCQQGDPQPWARPQQAICVFGFDMGGRKSAPDAAAFNLFVEQSRPLTNAIGVPLLPIHTNLRHLDDRPGFWSRMFVGFALAAVAQTLREHVSMVSVATPGEPLSAQVQAPFGTHPSLAPYCNTEALRTVMPFLEVTRFNRLALIAQSEDALNALRVCFGSDARAMNCGRCEKCVRTQLGLLLHGQEPSRWFSGVRLDAALLDRTDIASDAAANMAAEMLHSRQMAKHPDLAQASRRQLARWNRYKTWRDGHTLGGRLRGLLRATHRGAA